MLTSSLFSGKKFARGLVTSDLAPEMAMSLLPEQIDLIGDEIAIRWNDGTEDFYPMEFLRAASPSAENRGETDILGRIHGGTGQRRFPGVKVVRWNPVGGYAVQLVFSDGHSTGLYGFDYLKTLAARLKDAS